MAKEVLWGQDKCFVCLMVLQREDHFTFWAYLGFIHWACFDTHQRREEEKYRKALFQVGGLPPRELDFRIGRDTMSIDEIIVARDGIRWSDTQYDSQQHQSHSQLMPSPSPSSS